MIRSDVWGTKPGVWITRVVNLYKKWNTIQIVGLQHNDNLRSMQVTQNHHSEDIQKGHDNIWCGNWMGLQ